MLKRFFLVLFSAFISFNLSSQIIDNVSSLNVNQLLQDYYTYKSIHDSLSRYERILDEYDDNVLDEDHPCDDLYHNIWTSQRLNPYKIPIDSISDSIRINCSEFVLPVPGHVTSKFGFRRYRYHFGTDLKLYTGEPVKVAFSGKVRIIDYERKGYGHYVVVRHNNGLETVYGHLSKVLVKHDQLVCAGDTIALGGNTGRSTGSHLHFEVRYLGNAIDPANVIDFNSGTLRNDEYLITKNESFYYNQDLKALQAAAYVTVKSGDTLSHIATRNGTSISNICRLNNISTKTVIRPGQKIRVR